MNSILKISDLYFSYEGRDILKNIKLEIFPQDFLGIIGPNGGGKTTLLKLLMGLLKPDSGEIKAQKGLKIGYLPQYKRVDYDFPITVLDVVLSGLMKKNKLFFSREEKKAAMKILDEMGIGDSAGKRVDELSGGQAQRVFLCRSLIAQPNLLLLDEPDTFVDKKFKNHFYRIMKKLNEKIAIVMVSHDLGIISSYVKTIACVNQTLYYHHSRKIDDELLKNYHCPVEIITHGRVPHRVLEIHKEENDV